MLRKLLRKYPFEWYIVRFYIVREDISLWARHKKQSGEDLQSLSKFYVTLLCNFTATRFCVGTQKPTVRRNWSAK